ncbi:MAG TPA: sigma-70 family RNA polymerase sigma factor [Acidimicrobiales bacterium]|nr:sigma-70 family RNA polymerase sigma factor [Acidimicrobiales bacterium]
MTVVDDAAFRELFDAHLADVWRYARRRCTTSADADDVAGETFAVAWRRRADVPPDGGDARLWLLGTARRVLANQRRSQGRQHRLHVRVASVARPVPAEARDGSALWDALSRLTPEERDLLIMRAWDELPVTEMAVLLGCTPNAVSLRLRKARRRLADALDRTESAGSRTSPARSRPPEGGQP